MPSGLYLVLLGALLVTQVFSAPKDKVCLKNNNNCIKNEECCGGCCDKEKCVDFSESCVAASNPCSLFECPPNKVCYLHRVTCNGASCPSIPACMSPDYDQDWGHTNCHTFLVHLKRTNCHSHWRGLGGVNSRDGKPTSCHKGLVRYPAQVREKRELYSRGYPSMIFLHITYISNINTIPQCIQLIN